MQREPSEGAWEKAVRHALKELGYAWNGFRYQHVLARTHADKGA